MPLTHLPKRPYASWQTETATPKTDTIVRPGVTYEVIPDEELEKPYRVMIENDDVTPMDFVVMVLRSIFALSFGRATRIMMEAHRNGVAHVVSLPLAEAQEKVYTAHSLAREAGYPLSFYLEPEA